MALQFTSYFGASIQEHIDDIASLRISVFKEYPYLYDGDRAYEAQYLAHYADNADALCIIAQDNDQVVAASTAMPLHHANGAFQRPFLEQNIAPQNVYYFGESVVKPEHRGRGIGSEFFRRRETHATEIGAELTAFCAVDRSSRHPKRPPNYRPPDTLWARQGYTKHPEMRVDFYWREIGEEDERTHTLVVWTKELARTKS